MAVGAGQARGAVDVRSFPFEKVTVALDAGVQARCGRRAPGRTHEGQSQRDQ